LTVKRTVTSDTDRAEGIAPVVAPARAPSAEDDPTAPADGAIARIRFSGTLDNGTYQMSKDDILIGRGGNKHVDLRLNHPSVSRVHLRIRRLPGTSRFLVQNRGDYGATMNGTPIPRLEPDSEGGMEMPSRATIDLANQSVVLTFEAAAR
jgi:pSer/pThr/pTyr-binding forkhead associated (FHA) protein